MDYSKKKNKQVLTVQSPKLHIKYAIMSIISKVSSNHLTWL